MKAPPCARRHWRHAGLRDGVSASGKRRQNDGVAMLVSKIGAMREALLGLHAEHKRDGALPTSARFLFYELLQRSIISKRRTGARRPDQLVHYAFADLREDGRIPWPDIVASGWYALAGFERMATRRILGTVSLSSSSCLATICRPALPDIPVTFPPGRARLAMSPVPTGSRTVIMTMGIVSVAFLAAVTPCVPSDTMRSTSSRTSSAAKSGSRSTRSSAYR